MTTSVVAEASFPPPLRPGDTVAVVAASSPFPPTLGWVALGFLRSRYVLRFDRGMFARAGYLAGSDARRRTELAAALADPDVRAIVAARGGYGATRFVHELDWQAFSRAPKWIVGFSDTTALHAEAARVGVASIHADHLTALGQGSSRLRSAWVDALEHPERASTFEGLEVLARGAHAGPLVGGNLTVLFACAAAGRLRVPPGAVLLLEDVGEKPYRLDRMLTGLVVGGHLERVGAVVLGDFTDCAPNADRVTARDVLLERLTTLGVPIVSGLPIGHGARNVPIVLGAWTEVDADGPQGTVRSSTRRH